MDGMKGDSLTEDKLSETFRGMADYVQPIALAWAKMTRAALHAIASTLEASPVTIPGLRVPPPDGPVSGPASGPTSQGG
jgi:hypothetical protein